MNFDEMRSAPGAAHVPEEHRRVAASQAAMVEALLRLRGLDPRTGVSSWHRHPGESLPVYAFTYNQHFDVLREDAADPGPVVAAVVSRYGDRGAVGECVREDSAAFVEWGILLDEDMMGRFLAREIPAFDDAPGATLAEFLVALREPAFRADTEVAQWRAEASAAAAYLVPESPTAVRVALLVDGEGNPGGPRRLRALPAGGLVAQGVAGAHGTPRGRRSQAREGGRPTAVARAHRGLHGGTGREPRRLRPGEAARPAPRDRPRQAHGAPGGAPPPEGGPPRRPLVVPLRRGRRPVRDRGERGEVRPRPLRPKGRTEPRRVRAVLRDDRGLRRPPAER